MNETLDWQLWHMGEELTSTFFQLWIGSLAFDAFAEQQVQNSFCSEQGTNGKILVLLYQKLSKRKRSPSQTKELKFCWGICQVLSKHIEETGSMFYLKWYHLNCFRYSHVGQQLTMAQVRMLDTYFLVLKSSFQNEARCSHPSISWAMSHIGRLAVIF